MATRFYNTNAGLGDRRDLGMVGSKWIDKYGTSPESQNVAIKLKGRLRTSLSGLIKVADENTFNEDNYDTQTGARYVAGPVPEGPPGSYTTYNVTLHDFGKRISADALDETAKLMMESGGLAAVDEWLTQRSVRYACNYMDYELSATIAAASTAWTEADNAAATVWSDSTADIPADMAGLLVDFDSRVNSCIISWKAWQYFKYSPSISSRFGGNIGAGGLTDKMGLEAMSTWGITNVYVGRTAQFANYVNFFLQGEDPMMEPSGIVMALDPTDDQDEWGFTYFVTEPNERTRAVYAKYTGDITVNPGLGVRLTGAY